MTWKARDSHDLVQNQVSFSQLELWSKRKGGTYKTAILGQGEFLTVRLDHASSGSEPVLHTAGCGVVQGNLRVVGSQGRACFSDKSKPPSYWNRDLLLLVYAIADFQVLRAVLTHDTTGLLPPPLTSQELSFSKVTFRIRWDSCSWVAWGQALYPAVNLLHNPQS